MYAKDKNLPNNLRDTPGLGSVRTWMAIDAQTKLVLAGTLERVTLAQRTISSMT